MEKKFNYSDTMFIFLQPYTCTVDIKKKKKQDYESKQSTMLVLNDRLINFSFLSFLDAAPIH